MSGFTDSCHAHRAGRHRRERLVAEIWPERENRPDGTDSDSETTEQKPQEPGGEDCAPRAENRKGVKLNRTSQSGWCRKCFQEQRVTRTVLSSCAYGRLVLQPDLYVNTRDHIFF